MKVLHVIPAYVPAVRYGGAVPLIRDLARYLQDLGLSSTIWTTDLLARDAVLTERIDEVDVLRFRNIVAIRRPLALQVPPALLSYAMRNVSQFDVVHLHEVRTIPNVMVARAAHRAEVPIVVMGHGTARRAPGRLAKRVFDEAFAPALIKGAARFIALSEAEKGDLIDIGARQEDIAVIPNAIRIEDYPLGSQFGNFRRREGIPMTAPLVLFFARLHRSKSPVLALEAFAMYRRRAPDAYMAFVGPDDGAGSLIQRRVRELGLTSVTRITGMLVGQEKLDAMRDADVMVTPEFRGFPIAFLEAAAMGVPIVTTTLGDPLGFVKRVGYVADANAPGIADTLREAVGTRQRLASARRQVIERDYSWGRVAKLLHSTYENAIRDREERP